jgi:hypothetical protein
MNGVSLGLACSWLTVILDKSGALVPFAKVSEKACNRACDVSAVQPCIMVLAYGSKSG